MHQERVFEVGLLIIFVALALKDADLPPEPVVMLDLREVPLLKLRDIPQALWRLPHRSHPSMRLLASEIDAESLASQTRCLVFGF
jgi:hypothetical protein